jgi:ankyrin repeat protein
LLHGADIHATDSEGYTAVFLAARDISLDLPEILLDQLDVTPNSVVYHEQLSRPTWRTWLLLEWVVEAGYEDVVEFLLARGDVDPDAGETATPLWWAAHMAQPRRVRLFAGYRAS